MWFIFPKILFFIFLSRLLGKNRSSSLLIQAWRIISYTFSYVWHAKALGCCYNFLTTQSKFEIKRDYKSLQQKALLIWPEWQLTVLNIIKESRLADNKIVPSLRYWMPNSFWNEELNNSYKICFLLRHGKRWSIPSNSQKYTSSSHVKYTM